MTSIEEKLAELEYQNLELKTKLASFENENECTSLIIDHFSDGLILLDEKDCILLINPSAANLLRVSPEGARGKQIRELSTEPGQSLLPFLHETKETMTDISREVELSHETTVNVHIAHVSQKNKLHRMLVLHDVTREKTLLELKGEFVSIAAHQMRTPLSAIKWAFEIALSELDPKGEKANAVRRGYESTDRMLELVIGLLDVDRIESGRFDYRYTRMDLAEFTRLYIEEVAAERALLHSVRISFHNDTNEPVMINGDSDKLRLVLQNLTENSLKYTPAGGEVRVIISVEGSEAVLTFADSGIGIPKEAQEHLFQKFFRAENAKRNVPDGSGLGLYIVKNISEAHGGHVAFESSEGKGTTFYVRIPVHTR